MKLVRIALFAAGVFALVAFAGVGLPGRAHSQAGPVVRSSITVSGRGLVRTVPNRAGFSFGVTTQGRTATQALNANAGEMRRVINALKAAGVAAADIQTAFVFLSPRYTNDGNDIIGYTASNTVSAVLRDLDKAGAVIDAAVSAGANQVFGPALNRSDQEGLYRTALRAAVANAKAKAQTIASASGVRLRGVRSVIEGGGAPPPQPVEAGRAAPAEPTPIEPGTQTIEADVTVEFAVS